MKLKKRILLLLTTAFITSCSISIPINLPVDLGEKLSKSSNSSDSSEILRKKNLDLKPDGKSKFEWNLKITSDTGKKLSNEKIEFSVEAINPDLEWRNVDFLAKKFGSTSNKFKTQVGSGIIKLIGSVAPKQGFTDKNGEITVVYTSSNIGSNTEDSGQEKIVAKYGDKKMEQIINLSYPDMVAIPSVDNFLRISGATGVYVHKNIAKKLLALVEKIKEANWTIPITITAGNLRHGGLYPPHFTHRTGLEIDFRPMSKDGKPTWCNPDGKYAENYDREKTIEFINLAKVEGVTEIFFNDPKLSNIGVTPLEGHSDHLHISFSL